MTTPTRFAVVLTHNRPEMLRDAVAAILPQVDITLVIDNASDPAVELSIFDGLANPEHYGVLLCDDTQPANLPRLWRIGLERALLWKHPGNRAHVAFVQDDTTQNILQAVQVEVEGQRKTR